MVSSISASNYSAAALRKTSVKQSDVKTLVKYMGGETISTPVDTFASNLKSNAKMAVFFEGLPLLSFAKNSHKLSKLGGETAKGVVKGAMNSINGANASALNNLVKGEGKFLSRLSNYVKTTSKSKDAYEALRSATGSAAKAAKVAAKAGGQVGDDVIKAIANTGTKVVQEGTKKGLLGKLGSMFKTPAGSMIIFSGLIELFTEVVPTFKELGSEKGMKQLGKSAVKVLGDTVGFLGGQAAGVALGSAIGTALFPGVGTAIGAVVGMIGGCMGSWLMSKVTTKMTGESERTIAANKEADKNARKIAKDSDALAELKNSVIAKLEEEAAMNNGQLSEDSLLAYQALQNLDATNPYATV